MFMQPLSSTMLVQARSSACERGRKHSECSSGPKWNMSSIASFWAIIAECLSITPFGSPVVPEV